MCRESPVETDLAKNLAAASQLFSTATLDERTLSIRDPARANSLRVRSPLLESEVLAIARCDGEL